MSDSICFLITFRPSFYYYKGSNSTVETPRLNVGGIGGAYGCACSPRRPHPRYRGRCLRPGWSSPGNPSDPPPAAASHATSGSLRELWPSPSPWRTLCGRRDAGVLQKRATKSRHIRKQAKLPQMKQQSTHQRSNVQCESATSKSQPGVNVLMWVLTSGGNKMPLYRTCKANCFRPLRDVVFLMWVLIGLCWSKIIYFLS